MSDVSTVIVIAGNLVFTTLLALAIDRRLRGAARSLLGGRLPARAAA